MMYIAILLVILACNSVFMYACLIVAKRADQDEEIMFQKRINEKAGENMEKAGQELKVLLLPKDPNDDRNVIVEIRGGAGGEEAALFAGTLFRMYSMYAETKGWKPEILSSNPTELGGFKEVSFMIEGEGAYSRFKFESGRASCSACS